MALVTRSAQKASMTDSQRVIKECREHESSSCRRRKSVVTLVLMVAVMKSTRGVVAERGKVCIALVVMVAVMESTRVVVAEGGKVWLH
eukprot:scaffold1911_cov266-Chaetoceros_neogracile.AAC.25